MPEIKEFTSGAVVMDDRYSPILLTTFFGEVSLEAARWHGRLHQAQVREHAQRGAAIVTITDSSLTKTPSAEVRKYWAEMTRNLPAELKEATLGASVVIRSPLVRGVLTALSWLNEDLRTVESFDSMEAAFRSARRMLIEAGRTAPAELTRYVLPAEAVRLAASWTR